MATYKVTDPETGKTFRLTGDAPPTEQEINEVFSQVQSNQPQKEPGFMSNLAQNAKEMGGGLTRIARGINDLPADIYNSAKSMFKGQPLTDTPLFQDAKTVGGAVMNAVPKIVNQKGNYRLEPGAIYRQYESLAAQPLKYVPGIGDDVKAAYPENPLYEKPLDSALALLPLAKPLAAGASKVPILKNATQAVGEKMQGVAQNMGRRSLGLTKRYLGKEGELEAGNRAAQTALDQGVIRNPITNPFSSSADDMLARAEKLDETSGRNIGNFLKDQNKSFDWQKTVSDLEELKMRFPADPTVISQIDNVKAIVEGTAQRHKGRIPFEEANRLKSYIQNKINWNSDKASAQVGQQAAGTIRGSLDNQLNEVSGAGPDFQAFKQNKKIFGDTQLMQKGLLNKRSADSGNLMISPYSVLVGAGSGVGTGSILKGIATTMATEWAKRYGAATASTMANNMAKLFLGDPSKYVQILGPVGKGSASFEVIENALSNDPDFNSILRRRVGAKPIFRKAG